jgi:O-acetyl-ADP-ribose deacetylase
MQEVNPGSPAEPIAVRTTNDGPTKPVEVPLCIGGHPAHLRCQEHGRCCLRSTIAVEVEGIPVIKSTNPAWMVQWADMIHAQFGFADAGSLFIAMYSPCNGKSATKWRNTNKSARCSQVAAGPELATACSHVARLAPGEAVLTEAFDLPNIGVIHCVGPGDRRDEAAPHVLSRCYENALRLSENEAISSISFPALLNEANRYPPEDAAAAACKTVIGLAPDFRHIRLVRFVVHRQSAYQVFSRHLVRAAAELTGPGGQMPKAH